MPEDKIKRGDPYLEVEHEKVLYRLFNKMELVKCLECPPKSVHWRRLDLSHLPLRIKRIAEKMATPMPHHRAYDYWGKKMGNRNSVSPC